MKNIDNSKVFVTFRQLEDGSTEPVAVCPTEELAQKRVGSSRAAEARLSRLWDEYVNPYRVSMYSVSSVETEECYLKSLNGFYYSTPGSRICADKEFELEQLPEVQDLKKKYTGEDYYLAVPVVG